MFTDDQYREEYQRFVRSPRWELLNIERALQMLPWLNGGPEQARLAAVRDLLAIKKKG